MMHHLVSKVSRRVFYSVGALCHNASCSSMVIKHYFSTIPALQRKFGNTQKISVPSNFLKWGSLGFCKKLSFATGFTPLQPKPLETIIDVERAKNKSPEELADIWDDVWFFKPMLLLFQPTLLPFLSLSTYIFTLHSESITIATKSADD